MFPRLLRWVLGVCGVIGLIAAFTLTVEKFELATDPDYTPTCSLNPIVNCGSIMDTPQAAVFGFPNSLLGIAGFTAVLAIAVLLTPATPAWIWMSTQVGLSAAVVFVHWLIVQSLYEIGALCPYCMAVWLVVVVAFWYVTLRNLDRIIVRGRARRLVDALISVHSVVPVVWALTILTLIIIEFWWYWSTLG
nr:MULTISPECIES: vitamin K epoxide reductase family protein [Williamsia]